MLGKLKFFLLTATLLCGVACSPLDPENGENGGGQQPDPPTVTEINGTTIKEGNNIFGLITDSSTGKGIAGVPVTDGATFVVTDANGVYQMAATRWAKRIWFTIPAEYEVPVDPNNGRPLFYATEDIVRSSQNRNDWVLTPLAKAEDEFTIIAIGDPQCEVAAEAERFRSETLVDISTTVGQAQSSENRYHNAYALTLGDITFDNTPLWPTMAKLCSSITLSNGNKVPVFNCIGNHDHDASRQDDATATELYVENVGPTDYSFNRGKVHFVVMDNIVCTTSSGSTWSYNAGFSSQQYKWLKQDLDLVQNKEEKMVILSCHIPFRGGSTSGGSQVNKDKYYAEVLQLLTQFKEAHIFIGHTHYPQNYVHNSYKAKGGAGIYEHIHGAACGGWWTSNIGVDGSPNGFSIYEVKGATLHNWVAKGTNMNMSTQMRVYNGNDSYSGTKGYVYTWPEGGTGGSKNIVTAGRSYLKDCVIATIWNDDLYGNWAVDLVVDGKSYPMKRITDNVADMCACAFFFNEKGKNTTSWNKALMHYWYVSVPSLFPGKTPSDLSGWEVRATHTIKTSGEKNVYSETSFTSSHAGF